MRQARDLKSTGYARIARDRTLSDNQFRLICILAGAAPRVFFKSDGTPWSTGDRDVRAREETLRAMEKQSSSKLVNTLQIFAGAMGLNYLFGDSTQTAHDFNTQVAAKSGSQDLFHRGLAAANLLEFEGKLRSDEIGVDDYQDATWNTQRESLTKIGMNAEQQKAYREIFNKKRGNRFYPDDAAFIQHLKEHEPAAASAAQENSWSNTLHEHKGTAAAAVGTVAALYAAYRYKDYRHTKTLADALDDLASDKADIVPRTDRGYGGELKRVSQELHDMFKAARGDVAALRQALFRYRPGITGRTILCEHVIRADGGVRSSLGEIAAAITGKKSWLDVGNTVRNMFRTPRSSRRQSRSSRRQSRSSRRRSRRNKNG